jgi:hypothetical protein
MAEYKIGQLAHVAGNHIRSGIRKRVGPTTTRDGKIFYTFEGIFKPRIAGTDSEKVEVSADQFVKPATAEILQDVILALKAPPADLTPPPLRVLREIYSSKDIRRIARSIPALHQFVKEPERYPAPESVREMYLLFEDIIAAEFAAFPIVKRQLGRTLDTTGPFIKKARTLVRGMLAGVLPDTTLADFSRSDEEIAAAEKQKAAKKIVKKKVVKKKVRKAKKKKAVKKTAAAKKSNTPNVKKVNIPADFKNFNISPYQILLLKGEGPVVNLEALAKEKRARLPRYRIAPLFSTREGYKFAGDPPRAIVHKWNLRQLSRPEVLIGTLKALADPPVDGEPSLSDARRIIAASEPVATAVLLRQLHAMEKRSKSDPSLKWTGTQRLHAQRIVTGEFAAYAAMKNNLVEKDKEWNTAATDRYYRIAGTRIRQILTGEKKELAISDFLRSDREIAAAARKRLRDRRKADRLKKAETEPQTKELDDEVPHIELYRGLVLLRWKDGAVRACVYRRADKERKFVRPLFPSAGREKMGSHELTATRRELRKTDKRDAFANAIGTLGKPPSSENHPPTSESVAAALSSKDVIVAGLLSDLHFWRLRANYETGLEEIPALYSTVLDSVTERMAAHIVSGKTERHSPPKAAAIFARTKNRLELALDGKLERIELKTFLRKEEPARLRTQVRSGPSPGRKKAVPPPYQKGEIILYRLSPEETYKAGLYEERDHSIPESETAVYKIRLLSAAGNDVNFVHVPSDDLKKPDSREAVEELMTSRAPSLIIEAVAARVITDMMPRTPERRAAFDAFDYYKRVHYVMARLSEGRIRFQGYEAFTNLDDARMRSIEKFTGIDYFPKRAGPAVTPSPERTSRSERFAGPPTPPQRWPYGGERPGRQTPVHHQARIAPLSTGNGTAEARPLRIDKHGDAWARIQAEVQAVNTTDKSSSPTASDLPATSSMKAIDAAASEAVAPKLRALGANTLTLSLSAPPAVPSTEKNGAGGSFLVVKKKIADRRRASHPAGKGHQKPVPEPSIPAQTQAHLEPQADTPPAPGC